MEVRLQIRNTAIHQDSLCLNQVHEEIKGDITSFLELYRLTKAAGMKPHHVIRLIAVANDHLLTVEYRYQELKREEASLQAGNQKAAIIFQELSDQISDLSNTQDSYYLSCEKEKTNG